VVDSVGAGLRIPCPTCSKPIQIPTLSQPPVATALQPSQKTAALPVIAAHRRSTPDKASETRISRATLIGASGAWKDVLDRLEAVGVSVSRPKEIEPKLRELKDSYNHKIAQIRADIANEARNLGDEIQQDKGRFDKLVAEKHQEVLAAIHRLDIQIAALGQEMGFWKKLVNWFKIKFLEIEKKRWLRRERDYALSLRAAISQKERRLLYIQQNGTRIFEERKRDLDVTIATLENVLNSPDLAGAEAELEVEEILKKMPLTHYVLSNVRLRADEYIHFDGQALQSAQIDYLVVSAAGVFVIEVKRWSRNFAASGDFHNPYQQVKRAGYLCYRLLRDRNFDTKVQNVIVSLGSLPDREDHTARVKVLRPNQLIGYLTWPKWTEKGALHPTAVEGIKDFLANYVEH
jgi:hypothetical protein